MTSVKNDKCHSISYKRHIAIKFPQCYNNKKEKFCRKDTSGTQYLASCFRQVNTMDNLMYRTIRFVCKPLFTVLYRPKIIGAENIPERGGAVLAGNHMHALDPILIDVSTKRIVRTLAKSELFEGFWGFIFRGVAAIPVDLHAKKNPAALNAAIEALKNGSLINLSPEAKRNYTEYLLLPFKYGAVSMADKTKTPIIPYAIAGRYIPLGGLTVKFGKPFYTTSDLREDNKRLYEEITRLLLEISPHTQKTVRSFEEWESETAEQRLTPNN